MTDGALHRRVEQAVLEIDAILSIDGTRVKLVETTLDGMVRLKMTGDCPTCGEGVMVTLKKGIDRMIREQVPEVQSITID